MGSEREKVSGVYKIEHHEEEGENASENNGGEETANDVSVLDSTKEVVANRRRMRKGNLAEDSENILEDICNPIQYLVELQDNDSLRCNNRKTEGEDKWPFRLAVAVHTARYCGNNQAQDMHLDWVPPEESGKTSSCWWAGYLRLPDLQRSTRRSVKCSYRASNIYQGIPWSGH